MTEEIIPLSQKAFNLALSNGLGRAKLHVIHCGIDDVAHLVLEACIHNQTYDSQCEDSRADWLFSMFYNSNYYAKFRKAILNALANENEAWDLLQLCQLAKEMATEGDTKAHQALRTRVFEIASSSTGDDWIGADEWVELEGEKGVLELAKIYGQRLLNDGDDFVNDSILYVDEKEEKYKEFLFRHSKRDPLIHAYWDYIEKSRSRAATSPVDIEITKQQNRERFRSHHPFDKIINDAHTGVGEFPGHYVGFGRYATTEELDKIYSLLLKEPDESVIVRLLWVFRRTPMPYLNSALFEWATGTHKLLRSASIAALSQMSDSQVHNLAQSKVANNEILGADSEAIDLFIHNYESDDAKLIEQALNLVKPDREDAHSLGYSVLSVVKQQKDAALAEALEWVYENTPCTNCRYRAIVQLDGFQQLKSELIQECFYDASPEIREFAQECGV